jgi:hypothetical protein
MRQFCVILSAMLLVFAVQGDSMKVQAICMHYWDVSVL